MSVCLLGFWFMKIIGRLGDYLLLNVVFHNITHPRM
jgi:hypothetical protein